MIIIIVYLFCYFIFYFIYFLFVYFLSFSIANPTCILPLPAPSIPATSSFIDQPAPSIPATSSFINQPAPSTCTLLRLSVPSSILQLFNTTSLHQPNFCSCTISSSANQHHQFLRLPHSSHQPTSAINPCDFLIPPHQPTSAIKPCSFLPINQPAPSIPVTSSFLHQPTSATNPSTSLHPPFLSTLQLPPPSTNQRHQFLQLPPPSTNQCHQSLLLPHSSINRPTTLLRDRIAECTIGGSAVRSERAVDSPLCALVFFA